jgi:hypothetical protein
MLARLLELEVAGWDALVAGHGAQYYDETMTPEAVMVVPGAVLERADAIDALARATPWSDYEIEDAEVVPLWGDGITLVYRVTAHRPNEPEYRALMSSTYVRDATDEPWTLAFHQQTPLPS